MDIVNDLVEAAELAEFCRIHGGDLSSALRDLEEAKAKVCASILKNTGVVEEVTAESLIDEILSVLNIEVSDSQKRAFCRAASDWLLIAKIR